MGELLSKYRETDKTGWSKIVSLSFLGLTGLVLALLFFKVLAVQKGAAEIESIFEIGGILESVKQFVAYFNILRVTVIAGLVFLTVDFLAYKEEQRWLCKLAGLSSMAAAFLAVISYWKLGSTLGRLTSLEALLSMDSDTAAAVFESSYTLANILLAVSTLSAAAGIVFWVLCFKQKKVYVLDGFSIAVSNRQESESQGRRADTADSALNDSGDGMISQTQQGAVTAAAENGPEEAKVPKEPIDWKKYKVHGIAAGGILAAAALFLVWNTFFNFTEVDVFEHVSVEYQGVDGRGSVVIGGIYDAFTDEKIQEFLDTVKYSADKTSELSDGDTIVLSAEYDKELMKKNKIKVNEFQKEYTVKGLDIIPKTVSEIEGYEAIQTELKSKAKVLCEEEYKNNSYQNITSYKLSEETFFYGDSETDGSLDAYNREREYYYGTLAVVYKVTYTVKYIFGDTRTETEYVMYTYTGIMKDGKTGVYGKGKYSPGLRKLRRTALAAVEIDLESDYKLKKAN